MSESSCISESDSKTKPYLQSESGVMSESCFSPESEEYLPREIKFLVVHCSATRCNVSFSPQQLEKCHRANGWDGTGYHFYITRDGFLHQTRPVSRPGIHAKGFNRNSIGICYEGGLNESGQPADTRTHAQRDALADVLTILQYQYPQAKILGHYQLSANMQKACPCFDAEKEYSIIL